MSVRFNLKDPSNKVKISRRASKTDSNTARERVDAKPEVNTTRKSDSSDDNQLDFWEEKTKHADENFLQFAGKGTLESDEHMGHCAYSHYNHHFVEFLLNGEVVECVTQTIPDNTVHAFASYPYVLFILMLSSVDAAAIFQGNLSNCLLFGADFTMAFLFYIFLIGIPSLSLALFIGSRFQGHLCKIYVGFIGLVILQFLQLFMSFMDSLYQLAFNCRLFAINSAFYSPMWARFIPPSSDQRTSFETMIGYLDLLYSSLPQSRSF